MRVVSLASSGVFLLGFAIAAASPAACTDTGSREGEPASSSGDASSGTDADASSGTDADASSGTDADASSGTDADASQPNGQSGSGPSCATLPAVCAGTKDCCAAASVPGGTYARANDPSYPATISDFALDVYEVTVGRFRAFVDAGKGTQAAPPAVGAGAHPKIPGSGWTTAFTTMLPATTADLKAALACDPSYPMWTSAAGANEVKPITCVSWWEALAFCAWDGGRLPTEAEWNYAASAGSEQRLHPWGAGIDATRASYDCTGDGSAAQACAFSDLRPVGSYSPQGDGKWGHADLVGNVWEWVLDYYVTPFRLASCVDCADLQAPANGYKAFRGGSFRASEYLVKNSDRLANVPTRQFDIGLRCARAAK
jgi:formylglycine-generating enzyme required for sulfatase activity